jgi:quercetin dioxygenase-like cupin family protein
MIIKRSVEGPVEATRQSIKRGVLLLGAAFALILIAISSLAAGTAMATPGLGVSQTPVASGVLAEPIRIKWKDEAGFGNGLDVSNVAIVKNIVTPGGYFGWHQHGGPSWIVVTRGTLTFYDADDPSCAGHPVSAGSAYFDSGNHTHNARNETDQTVENYVVRMLPVGGATRIDIDPGPETCDF